MAKPKKRSSKAKVKSLPTSRSKSKRVKGGTESVTMSPTLMNPMTPKALIYFAAQPPGGTQIR